MLAKIWSLIKDTVSGFLADDALSRGAAIAYFTIFSIAPLLIIVIAIASLVFGYETAQLAIVGQFTGLIGQQSAEALQSMIQSANLQNSGAMATILGVGALLLTASGAFGEIQSSLNVIWKAKPRAGLSRLVRARLAGLGLVLTLGFLMLVSLVISAGLTAVGTYVDSLFPGAHALMMVATFVISLALLSVLFAAIFKLLPDQPIAWRDVAIGAFVTALLFTIGKTAIGLYIGSSQVASGFGAAGALIVLLVWIYYSSLIFLLGAEFTRAYAQLQGSHAEASAGDPVAAPTPPIDILALEAALTRQDIDATWRLIRARVPNPALPDAAGRRPSLLQLAVAGLAMLTLPRAPRAPLQQGRRERMPAE